MKDHYSGSLCFSGFAAIAQILVALNGVSAAGANQ
ncbi:hypothetical protein ABIB51_002669 [Arthrobacter sp. UYCu712]